MLVSHKFDHDKKIIMTIFAPEEVTLQLFVQSFMEYQEELRFLPNFRDYNELVDFRSITRINITAKELKEFGNLTLSTDQSDAITRLALLVDSKPAFTLAKVYETFRNISPGSRKRVKVFRNFDEALDWLVEPAAPDNNRRQAL